MVFVSLMIWSQRELEEMRARASQQASANARLQTAIEGATLHIDNTRQENKQLQEAYDERNVHIELDEELHKQRVVSVEEDIKANEVSPFIPVLHH